jgi:hypothetical protein
VTRIDTAEMAAAEFFTHHILMASVLAAAARESVVAARLATSDQVKVARRRLVMARQQTVRVGVAAVAVAGLTTAARHRNAAATADTASLSLLTKCEVRHEFQIQGSRLQARTRVHLV